MSTRSKLWSVIPPMVAVGVGLALLAGPMFPFREGNPKDFWLAATSVKLDPEAEAFGGAFYPPRDGWVVYELYYPNSMPMHGPTLYRVRVHDTMADFEQVVEKLPAIIPKNKVQTYTIKGYEAWMKRPAAERDALALLDDIRQARFAFYRETKPTIAQTLERHETYFNEEWRRSRFYALNLAFEFCLLNGLILFAFWPWLRNLKPWRWGLHAGLMPVILMAPWYLGYASWRVCFPKCGGVAYSWIVMALTGGGIPWTSVDYSIFNFLPRVLDPLNQGYGELNDWFAPSGPSPLTLLATGCAIGLLAFWLRWKFVRGGKWGGVKGEPRQRKAIGKGWVWGLAAPGAAAGGLNAGMLRSWEFGISWGGVGCELLMGLMVGVVIYGLAWLFFKMSAKRAWLGILLVAMCTAVLAEGWCGIEERSFKAEVKQAGVSNMERDRWWPYSSSGVYVHNGKYGAHD